MQASRVVESFRPFEIETVWGIYWMPKQGVGIKGGASTSGDCVGRLRTPVQQVTEIRWWKGGHLEPDGPPESSRCTSIANLSCKTPVNAGTSK